MPLGNALSTAGSHHGKYVHARAARGDADGVQRRIVGGAHVNYASPDDGATPLIAAASAGYVDVALVLLNAKCALNMTDKRQWTALMHAAAHGHVEVCEALLHHGADASVTCSEGHTALEWARLRGHATAADVIHTMTKPPTPPPTPRVIPNPWDTSPDPEKVLAFRRDMVARAVTRGKSRGTLGGTVSATGSSLLHADPMVSTHAPVASASLSSPSAVVGWESVESVPVVPQPVGAMASTASAASTLLPSRGDSGLAASHSLLSSPAAGASRPVQLAIPTASVTADTVEEVPPYGLTAGSSLVVPNPPVRRVPTPPTVTAIAPTGSVSLGGFSMPPGLPPAVSEVPVQAREFTGPPPTWAPAVRRRRRERPRPPPPTGTQRQSLLAASAMLQAPGGFGSPPPDGLGLRRLDVDLGKRRQADALAATGRLVMAGGQRPPRPGAAEVAPAPSAATTTAHPGGAAAADGQHKSRRRPHKRRPRHRKHGSRRGASHA